jgi:secondary thiamine-phosphate synthase enzyme
LLAPRAYGKTVGMACHTITLELPGGTGTDIHDVTAQVARAVAESKVHSGLVTVHVAGSTGAVTTIEYEPGALSDLTALLDRLAPQGADYAHEERWHDGNGHSHLRAALMGPSLTVPVCEGRPVLGTWQQIIVLDFDNKPRQRRVLVQVLGEEA